MTELPRGSEASVTDREMLKKTAGAVCARVKQATERLDTIEKSFAQQSPAKKAALVFAIAAAASVTPGGYIALEIWALRKLVQWAKKRDIKGRLIRALKKNGAEAPPGAR